MARRVARAAVGTAVVAGTANAVTHKQNQKYAAQDQAAQAGQQDAYQQGVADAQAAQQPVAPAAAPAQDDMTVQLEQLAELKNKGILTEEEFQAKKKQILGI
jgi:hypothetical protein